MIDTNPLYTLINVRDPAQPTKKESFSACNSGMNVSLYSLGDLHQPSLLLIIHTTTTFHHNFYHIIKSFYYIYNYIATQQLIIIFIYLIYTHILIHYIHLSKEFTLYILISFSILKYLLNILLFISPSYIIPKASPLCAPIIP